MRSGILKHIVAIQQKVSTSDGMGGYTNVWADLYETRAAIWPMKSSEILDAMKLELNTDHKIRIRHQKNIATVAGMRVRWLDLVTGLNKYFNIVSIINVDKRNVMLDLICVEDDTLVVPGYILKYSGGGDNFGQRVAQSTPDRYVGGEFTNIAEEYTVRRVQLSLSSGGSGQDLTWTFEIREFAAGEPSDVVLLSTTFTGNIPLATLTPYNIDFDPGIVLDASATYCVVLNRGGVSHLSNFITMGFLDTGTEKIVKDHDGVQPWTDVDTSATVYLKTYAYDAGKP